MSGHLLRRNTSKAGLQNLLRMTTQRSMEDAEEIERERRRRARERSQGSHNDQTGPASPTRLTQDNGPQETDALCESELKANGCQLALEEDEGFSDWTQRLEKRRQRHLEEQEGRGDRPPPALDQQPGLNGVAPTKPCLKTRSVPGPEETEEWEWSGSETQEAPQTVDGDKVAEKKRSELKISYTSNMKKHVRRNGETPGVEVTSYLVAGKMTPSLSPCLGQQVEEVDGGAHEGLMETQQKLGQGHGTLEQLRQRQQEDQEEMEEVNRRREERNRAREEEEQRRGEEESHKQKQVEEETRTVNEGIDRRRASAERRLKNLSISSNEGDESLGHFSPMSPTFKNEVEERMTTESACTLNERTESLNRSLQKSNSIKKTEPPLPISKIDNRLEQYTHAIEEAKVAKQQALTDLPSPSEPVASKKSLFEAGEAWSQTPKGTPSKDTEGLKVGVADLIHQWVKGNPDGSCKSPSSIPAEVKAGDVLSKKNLWENVGDSPSPGRVGKGAAGKKYKFVMMAHGKYEKVAVGDDA